MSITGRSSIRRLKDYPVVVDLDELGPVGRRATGGRDGLRFERFTEGVSGASGTSANALPGVR